MRAVLNFMKEVWSILSGSAFRDMELWSGPVTKEKLERQRDWLRKHSKHLKRS